jgi:1,2-diacylglycerol 3-alpha-glucosyltransferase
MKILLATDYFMPSLGYEAGLAEAYMMLGHDVLYSASHRVPAEKAGLKTRDENTAIPHRLHSALRIGSRHILIPGIAIDIARFKPNVVHAHTFFDLTSVMVALLKPVFKYRLVYSCHASHVNTDVASSAWRRVTYTVWRCIGGKLIGALADEMNAVGENEQAMVAWGTGKDISEVPIVRLGADLSMFSRPMADRRELRKRLGIGADDIVLVHVGTLAERKQVELLVRATTVLRRLEHGVSALIVGGGDPDYVASVRRVIEQEGAAQFVTLIDNFESRERVAGYYAISDIAVWPGDISIASIEAMASGLPLVLKAGDRYRDFLVSGENGVLYSAGNQEALNQSILDLVENRGLREKMGSNGRNFAEKEFAWLSIAKSLVSRMA